MKGIITGKESFYATHLVHSDRDEHRHLLIYIYRYSYFGSTVLGASPNILSAWLPSCSVVLMILSSAWLSTHQPGLQLSELR